jgi:hypothetical protein
LAPVFEQLLRGIGHRRQLEGRLRLRAICRVPIGVPKQARRRIERIDVLEGDAVL